MSCLVKDILVLGKMMDSPAMTRVKDFAGTAHCSLRLVAAAPDNWATLLQPFKPSKTRLFARHRRVYLLCKVAPEQARPLLRFTVLPTCCTRIVSRWKTKVYWLLGQTGCSCVISSAYCHHSVKRVCSKSYWQTLFLRCSLDYVNLRMLRE